MVQAPERASPGAGEARHVQTPAKGSDVHRVHGALDDAAIDELAMWREMRAWRQAAEYLNAAGFAAAIPAGLVGRFRRAGMAVWAARDRGVA